MSAPAGPLAVTHHHPGRLRVRGNSLASDPSLRARLTEAVRAMLGVGRVESSGVTGSLLVLYDPRKIDAGTLVEHIAELAGLDVQPLPSPRAIESRDVFAAARALDDRVHTWTGGRIGLRMGVPAALCLGSALSFVWGGHNRAPRWDNLLYWGIMFFWTLNPHSDDGVRAEADA